MKLMLGNFSLAGDALLCSISVLGVIGPVGSWSDSRWRFGRNQILHHSTLGETGKLPGGLQQIKKESCFHTIILFSVKLVYKVNIYYLLNQFRLPVYKIIFNQTSLSRYLSVKMSLYPSCKCLVLDFLSVHLSASIFTWHQGRWPCDLWPLTLDTCS